MNSDNKRSRGDGQAITPEKRADDIMRSVLGLNRAELSDVYRSQTSDDPTQKLYDLASLASAEYRERGESVPAHVQELLRTARQKPLLLEGLSLECSVPKVLLLDTDGERMMSRRAVLEAHQYRVELAFTLQEALDKLILEPFQAAIVEFAPTSQQDMEALHELQTWNLQIPIINVSAWARLVGPDERRFNWNLVRALARAFGRPMPRKRPERKPVRLDSENAKRSSDLFSGTGS